MTGENGIQASVALFAAILFSCVLASSADAQSTQGVADFPGTVRVEQYRNPIIFIRTQLDEQTGKACQRRASGHAWGKVLRCERVERIIPATWSA